MSRRTRGMRVPRDVEPPPAKPAEPWGAEPPQSRPQPQPEPAKLTDASSPASEARIRKAIEKRARRAAKLRAEGR